VETNSASPQSAQDATPVKFLRLNITTSLTCPDPSVRTSRKCMIIRRRLDGQERRCARSVDARCCTCSLRKVAWREVLLPRSDSVSCSRYFCRADGATAMPRDDPHRTSRALAHCDAAIASVLVWGICEIASYIAARSRAILVPTATKSTPSRLVGYTTGVTSAPIAQKAALDQPTFDPSRSSASGKGR